MSFSSEIFTGIPGYDPTLDASDYVFVEKKAKRAIEFFSECLTHQKGIGAGTKFVLEPWQRSIIGNTFGWIHKETKLRRYRKVFVYIPRKNGKTALTAGIILYCLTCDNEPGAEIYCAAGEREQASLIFEHAKGMVRSEEELGNRCKVHPTYRRIVSKTDPLAFIAVLSADVEHKHGFNAHVVVIDEVHVQPNRELIDVLTQSMGNRRQPLTMYLTTADYERTSICNELYDMACKVRDRKIVVPEFLPVIYETSANDDWHLESTWKKANPNYGISITQKYFQDEHNTAINMPSYQNNFKRFHLNMRTRNETKWLDLAQWDACQDSYCEEDLYGCECFAGLDLASKIDMCALSLWFPKEQRSLHYYWCPRNQAIKRMKKDNVPYMNWIEAKALIATEGDVVDQDAIRHFINGKQREFNLNECAIDRWEAAHIMTQLTGDGLTMTPWGQGFASMSSPSKEFESLIISKKYHHNGHPILRWNVDNATCERDAAGNIKPSKAKSTEKIDGVVSTIMSLGCAALRPTGSVYEERGVLVL